MTRSPRSHWKLPVALAFVVVGVGVMCLFVGKMRERKAIVGKVVKGYRFRCTVSTGWKPTQVYEQHSEENPEFDYFVMPPNPIRQWISTHLLRRQPTQKPAALTTPAIIIATDTGSSVFRDMEMKAGYPEPSWKGVTATIHSERHLLLDGCPTTILRWDIMAPGMTLRGTTMLVYQPDSPIAYFVSGVADPKEGDQAAREAEQIIASFHVEKAVSGSK